MQWLQKTYTRRFNVRHRHWSRLMGVARVVWERTTVEMPWLAERLNLRSAANAIQQIRRHRRQAPVLARRLQKWTAQSINAAWPLF
jgi:hypothetical protein